MKEDLKHIQIFEEDEPDKVPKWALWQKAKLGVKWLLARQFARKTWNMLMKVRTGTGQEAKETEEMVRSFFRLLESKLNLENRKDPPTKEEVKAAIEQLKDVGRFSIFAGISIFPGGGFSLIALELLARKFGLKNFTFVPSAFRKQEGKTEARSSKLEADRNHKKENS